MARQPETKLVAIAHTRHKARLRNVERSRTKSPKTQTRGVKQAKIISVEGRARPGVRVRPEAWVATFAPDRHRDVLLWQRATLSSRSAPEMKAV
jgi:hypothetical protein